MRIIAATPSACIITNAPHSRRAETHCRRYEDVATIFAAGPRCVDVIAVRIDAPLHRRLLKAAIGDGLCTVSDALSARVVAYSLGGSVALYAVSARYRCRRATRHVRDAHFLKLHATLRGVLRRSSSSSSSSSSSIRTPVGGLPDTAAHRQPRLLPELPRFDLKTQRWGHPAYHESRRAAFDAYLQAAVALASDVPAVLDALLAFLEVASVQALRDVAPRLAAPAAASRLRSASAPCLGVRETTTTPATRTRGRRASGVAAVPPPSHKENCAPDPPVPLTAAYSV